MRLIPLSKGKFAKVDDADYDWLMQWKWFFKGGYAGRSLYVGTKNGKCIVTTIRMHRVIDKTPSEFYTDHVDGDKLNNQRKNLRSATPSQNNMNKISSYGASKYKGVVWSKKVNKWQAQIIINKRYKYLGVFINEIEAAIAYNDAAIKAFGSFARLNTL